VVRVACRNGDQELRWPSRSPHDAGSPRRYRLRARRLTIADESAIRALAETNSLRSLAADFGVSHETVRAILRQSRGSD
jgi:hypothetical protein